MVLVQFDNKITFFLKKVKVILLSESLVCPLAGVEPKDTTKPKIYQEKGLIYYLQQVRTLVIFPKVVSPQTAELGKF